MVQHPLNHYNIISIESFFARTYRRQKIFVILRICQQFSVFIIEFTIQLSFADLQAGSGAYLAGLHFPCAHSCHKNAADTRNLRILHVICIGCIISNQSICPGHHAERIKSNIDCHSAVKVLIIPIGYNNMGSLLTLYPLR